MLVAGAVVGGAAEDVDQDEDSEEDSDEDDHHIKATPLVLYNDVQSFHLDQL